MSIDLETTEGRKQYLSDKLDDLLEGINDSYGTVLMEELLNRLELAIKDFNDEMKTLCEQLIKKQEKRQHLFEMLRAREAMSTEEGRGILLTSDDNTSLDIANYKTSENPENMSTEIKDDDIPIWEKKLAKLEKK